MIARSFQRALTVARRSWPITLLSAVVIGIVLANLRRPEAGQQIYGDHLDPVRQTEARTGSSEPAAHELIVSGTITARSAAPRAGQIPYADHIFALELSDLEVDKGTLAEPKIAVYLFSMRNHRNTPAFFWPMGKRLKLKLQPWKPEFFARYGRINRTDADDIELPQFWYGEVSE